MDTKDIDRKIAVIFATDAVGYSKHMEKDENQTLQSFETLQEPLIEYMFEVQLEVKIYQFGLLFVHENTIYNINRFVLQELMILLGGCLTVKN